MPKLKRQSYSQKVAQSRKLVQSRRASCGASNENSVAAQGTPPIDHTHELGTTSTRTSSGKIKPSSVLSAHTRSHPYSQCATQQKHGVPKKTNQSHDLDTIRQKKYSTRKSSGKVMPSSVLSAHTRSSPSNQCAAQQKHRAPKNQSHDLDTVNQKEYSTQKSSGKLVPSSVKSSSARSCPYTRNVTHRKHVVSSEGKVTGFPSPGQSHEAVSQMEHSAKKKSLKIMPSSVLLANPKSTPYSRCSACQKPVNPFKQHGLDDDQHTITHSKSKLQHSQSRYKSNTIEDAMKTNMSNYFDSQQRKNERRQSAKCSTTLGPISISHKFKVPHGSCETKTKSPPVNNFSHCKTDAQRMKWIRDHKNAEQKFTDKLKDKSRKSKERTYRSKKKQQSDKIKDAIRKQTARKARTETQVAAVQQQNKVHKQTVRAVRTKAQVISDKHQDMNRKQSARKARTETQVAAVQQQNKVHKQTVRALRSNKQLISDKQQDKTRKQMARTSQKQALTVERVLANYKASIREGPTYSCSCCCRLLYRRSVLHCVKERYTHLSFHELITVFPPENYSSWICQTCHTSLKTGKLPAQATANQLQLDEIPESLAMCCPFETQLISKVICFQKIFKKPRGAQHGIKGQAVLVPADLSKVSTCLPRATSDGQFIALALKRRLSDKHDVDKQFIRPAVVNEALAYLRDNNKYYADVAVNSQWEETSAQHDQHLWSVLTGQPSGNEDTVPNNDSEIGDASHIPSAQEHHDTSSPNPTPQQPDNEDTTAPSTSAPANPPPDEQEITDSEDEVELGNPSPVLDDLLNSRLVNCKTCIYPVLGPEPNQEYSPFGDRGTTPPKPKQSVPAKQSIPANKTINVAPGEGKTPVSRTKEPGWEAMAHPNLHPTGTTTYYTATKRKTKLSSKRYVNARLLHKDGRFAESAEFCFSALDWIETEEISSSISITARKRFQEDITVGDLRNPDRIGKLLTENQVFAAFKKIQGTPQSWKQMNLDMHAKLRQLGPYTFFITGKPLYISGFVNAVS